MPRNMDMSKGGSDMKKLIIQLIKFGIVGVIATIIDFAVLIFLKEVFKADVLLASALSFAVSVVANYFLSMLFVFKGNKENKVREFITFVLLSIGGLLINQFVMWVGTEIFSLYYLGVKIFACVFVPVYNFITRKVLMEKEY